MVHPTELGIQQPALSGHDSNPPRTSRAHVNRLYLSHTGLSNVGPPVIHVLPRLCQRSTKQTNLHTVRCPSLVPHSDMHVRPRIHVFVPSLLLYLSRKYAIRGYHSSSHATVGDSRSFHCEAHQILRFGRLERWNIVDEDRQDC